MRASYLTTSIPSLAPLPKPAQAKSYSPPQGCASPRTVQTVDQRAALERLIRERREDYAGLSRLLGRNAAYIQQFIKRGVPRKLEEEDRRTLASYFGVSESVLGGRAEEARRPALATLARLDVGASAGPGALVEDERAVAHMAFDEGWLRRMSGASPEELSIITVRGDSMAPTLADGDEIMVRRSGGEPLSDGIYVIRRGDELSVKRVALHPSAGTVAIRSDNPAYPAWPDCDPATIDVVGRVVWAGRKVS
jgi:hypothetical protein